MDINKVSTRFEIIADNSRDLVGVGADVVHAIKETFAGTFELGKPGGSELPQIMIMTMGYSALFLSATVVESSIGAVKSIGRAVPKVVPRVRELKDVIFTKKPRNEPIIRDNRLNRRVLVPYPDGRRA